MTVKVVRDIPELVSGIFTRPYLVRNSGATTVYLGQDSSLTTATRSITMPPGSTLNWEGSTELWAVMGTGETGEIEWLYDANSSFTPGPTEVDASIVGLVSVVGTVDIDGSVEVISQPDLQEIANTFGSDAVGKILYAGTTSDYATLIISHGTVSPLANVDQPVTIAVSIYDNAVNLRLIKYQEYNVHFYGSSTIVIPNLGGYVSVRISSSVTNTRCRISLLGSRVAFPESWRFKPGDTGLSSGLAVFNGDGRSASISVAATATGFSYMETESTDAFLNGYKGNTAMVMTIVPYLYTTGTLEVSAGTDFYRGMAAPKSACVMRYRNTAIGTATGAYWAIS